MEPVYAGVGVVVGRFQVSDLHPGQLAVLDHAANSHNKLLILVGVAPVVSKRDPLDFPTREAMLRADYPRAVILPQYDMEDDKEWSRQLDTTVRRLFPQDKATLYVGRKSFLPHYRGSLPHVQAVLEGDPEGEISGERDRQYLAGTIHGTFGTGLSDGPSFRHGVIYGQMNRFDKADMAVDIALLRQPPVDTPDEVEILLGRKRSDLPNKWRLPGGYVDTVKDDSLEATAKRELLEETGIVMEATPRYAGSFKVPDWRYRASNDRIYASLFVVPYSWGVAHAGDDLDKVIWAPLSSLKGLLIDDHYSHIDLIHKHLVASQIAQCATSRVEVRA
jgi:bifunctional NMN adenylyltransferase/nudix hydrolase